MSEPKKMKLSVDNFDSTVNAFGDFVTEVFSGPDGSQKTQLREALHYFTRISNESVIIHYVLPPEMVERIFKFLDFKEVCQAQRVCKRWKEIIDKGNLVKHATGKILIHLEI